MSELIKNEVYVNEIMNGFNIPSDKRTHVVDLFIHCRDSMLNMIPKKSDGTHYSTNDDLDVDSVNIAEDFAKELTTGIIKFMLNYNEN